MENSGSFSLDSNLPQSFFSSFSSGFSTSSTWKPILSSLQENQRLNRLIQVRESRLHELSSTQNTVNSRLISGPYIEEVQSSDLDRLTEIVSLSQKNLKLLSFKVGSIPNNLIRAMDLVLEDPHSMTTSQKFDCLSAIELLREKLSNLILNSDEILSFFKDIALECEASASGFKSCQDTLLGFADKREEIFVSKDMNRVKIQYLHRLIMNLENWKRKKGIFVEEMDSNSRIQYDECIRETIEQLGKKEQEMMDLRKKFNRKIEELLAKINVLKNGLKRLKHCVEFEMFNTWSCLIGQEFSNEPSCHQIIRKVLAYQDLVKEGRVQVIEKVRSLGVWKEESKEGVKKELKEMRERFEGVLKDVLGRLEGVKNEIKRKDEKICGLEKELGEEIRKTGELAEKNKKIEGLKEGLRNELDEERKKLKILNTENEVNKKILAEMRVNLQEAKSMNQVLKKDADSKGELLRELEDELSQKKKDFQQELAEKEASVKELKNKLDKENKAKEATRAEMEKQEELIGAIKNEIHLKEKSCEILKYNLKNKEQEISEMKTELDKERLSSALLKNQILDKENSIENLKRDLDKENRKSKCLQDEIQKNNELKENLIIGLEQQKQENEALRGKEKRKKEARKELRSVLNEEKKISENLREEVNRRDNLNGNINLELQTVNKICESLRDIIKKKKENSKGLKNQLGEGKELHESLKENLEKKELLNQELIEKLEKKEALNQELIEKLENKEDINQELIEKLYKKEALNQELIEKLDKKEALNQELIEKLENKEDLNQELIEKLEKEKALCESLNKKLENSDNLFRGKIEELCISQEAEKGKKESINKLSKKIIFLKHEFKTFKEEISNTMTVIFRQVLNESKLKVEDLLKKILEIIKNTKTMVNYEKLNIENIIKSQVQDVQIFMFLQVNTFKPKAQFDIKSVKLLKAGYFKELSKLKRKIKTFRMVFDHEKLVINKLHRDFMSYFKNSLESLRVILESFTDSKSSEESTFKLKIHQITSNFQNELELMRIKNKSIEEEYKKSEIVYLDQIKNHRQIESDLNIKIKTLRKNEESLIQNNKSNSDQFSSTEIKLNEKLSSSESQVALLTEKIRQSQEEHKSLTSSFEKLKSEISEKEKNFTNEKSYLESQISSHLKETQKQDDTIKYIHKELNDKLTEIKHLEITIENLSNKSKDINVYEKCQNYLKSLTSLREINNTLRSQIIKMLQNSSFEIEGFRIKLFDHVKSDIAKIRINLESLMEKYKEERQTIHLKIEQMKHTVDFNKEMITPVKDYIKENQESIDALNETFEKNTVIAQQNIEENLKKIEDVCIKVENFRNRGYELLNKYRKDSFCYEKVEPSNTDCLEVPEASNLNMSNSRDVSSYSFIIEEEISASEVSHDLLKKYDPKVKTNWRLPHLIKTLEKYLNNKYKDDLAMIEKNKDPLTMQDYLCQSLINESKPLADKKLSELLNTFKENQSDPRIKFYCRLFQVFEPNPISYKLSLYIVQMRNEFNRFIGKQVIPETHSKRVNKMQVLNLLGAVRKLFNSDIETGKVVLKYLKPESMLSTVWTITCLEYFLYNNMVPAACFSKITSQVSMTEQEFVSGLSRMDTFVSEQDLHELFDSQFTGFISLDEFTKLFDLESFFKRNQIYLVDQLHFLNALIEGYNSMRIRNHKEIEKLIISRCGKKKVLNENDVSIVLSEIGGSVEQILDKGNSEIPVSEFKRKIFALNIGDKGIGCFATKFIKRISSSFDE